MIMSDFQVAVIVIGVVLCVGAISQALGDRK
jgi:hypothetical protein